MCAHFLNRAHGDAKTTTQQFELPDYVATGRSRHEWEEVPPQGTEHSQMFLGYFRLFLE